jgi:hypothetical protein
VFASLVAVSEMENGACLDLDWEVYYGHDVHLTPGPGVNGSKQTIPPELSALRPESVTIAR